MNEDRLNGGGNATSACPEFGDLSRFVDGELEAERMEAVRTHLTSCTPCARLARRLNDRLPDLAAAEWRGGCAEVHGDESDLLLYLADGMTAGARRALDSHLAACDACVAELARLQRRLAIADSVEVAVPAAVREQARLALEPALRTLAAESAAARDRGTGIWAAVRRVLTAVLEKPALVPAAMAAGALFMVVVQETWVQPGRVAERSRAVEMQQRLRVTAASASVRSEPLATAEEIATLRKGTFVAVTGEDRDWLRVALPEGRSGWVERRAFD